MSQPVFRFAPSPNGRLHLGHAYSALLNARLARMNKGRFLLRIEDIDTTRCKPEYETAIYEDLAWLGLCWEKPVRRQSDHFDDYRGAFAKLHKRGLVYPCFCSRKDIQAQPITGRDPDGAPLYPGTCRGVSDTERRQRITGGAEHAWRLDMDKALATLSGVYIYNVFTVGSDFTVGPVQISGCEPRRWGDPVVVRKETPTTYHLSVVVDDALQGVTHVVRGQDLEAATDLHVLLQKLLCLPTPYYHHHALIRGEDGEKLSKSLMSEALSALRAIGHSPENIINLLNFG